MSDIALKIENLSKYYRLGVINNGTLRQDLKSWFALKRGKDDPNAKIGTSVNESDGFWALKDISIDIHQGDRVGIIGKNGAGKSTLLKIISGITSPTHGNIKIKGRISSLLEVGTGFNPELTGRENIYLNGAILGMKRKDVDRKIDEIIAFSEIEKHIDTPVKRYSSGMYVRLAFAVAAHLDSEILIADEVLAVGDAAFQKKALGKMNELSTNEGRTVIFVSHQMNALENLCKSGIILSKGKVVFQTNNIQKAIERYLLPENFGLNVNVWENKDLVKNNQNFFPLKMYILADNVVTTEINRLNKDVYCVIEAEIQEISSILNVGLFIKKLNGQILMATWLKDKFEDNRIKIGKNKFFIKLPNNIMNIGEYKLDLYVGLHHVSEIIPSDTVSLLFKVVGSINTEFGDDARNCDIVPIIKWEIK